MPIANLPYVLTHAPRISLVQAATRALSMSEPLRLRHDDGELLAEVYFFRDQVLHAHANGLDGLRAFAALQLCDLRYVSQVGIWPARCTIITTWEGACHEAELLRRRPPEFCRTDDEPTKPLD